MTGKRFINYLTGKNGLENLDKIFADDLKKELHWITVPLKRFEKTDLENELDRHFGKKPRSVYDDINKTYTEAIAKHGTEYVKVQTDLVEPMLYKVGPYEINIIN